MSNTPRHQSCFLLVDGLVRVRIDRFAGYTEGHQMMVWEWVHTTPGRATWEEAYADFREFLFQNNMTEADENGQEAKQEAKQEVHQARA